MAEIGLRIWDGSQIIEIPVDTDYASHKLRIAKNGTIYGIPLIDPSSPGALPIRINIGTPAVPDIKAIGTLGYYELNLLRRQYSGAWYNIVTNGILTGTDPYLVYSTTQGNWTPSPTETETLRLNIDGSHTTYGKHPVLIFEGRFRVYETFKVRVYCRGGGNHQGWIGSPTTNTYQRQDSTTILIDGSPTTISVGGWSGWIKQVNWYPGDHGFGHWRVRVHNAAANYFDVQVWCKEVDEQYDSSNALIDAYCEPAP
jgi:hypothetical protein